MYIGTKCQGCSCELHVVLSQFYFCKNKEVERVRNLDLDRQIRQEQELAFAETLRRDQEREQRKTMEDGRRQEVGEEEARIQEEAERDRKTHMDRKQHKI